MLFASKIQAPGWRLMDGNPQRKLGSEVSHSDQLDETSPTENPVRGPKNSLDRERMNGTMGSTHSDLIQNHLQAE